MLALHLPMAVMLLMPIILFESGVGWASVRRRPVAILREVALGNAISTLVGVPMTWVLMFLLMLARELTVGGGMRGIDSNASIFQSVILQAAWLAPYEWQLGWMIPAASAALLVPYFFVSVLVERWWLLGRLTEVPRRPLLRAVWLGNGLTYALLFGWAYYSFWRATEAGAVDLPPTRW